MDYRRLLLFFFAVLLFSCSKEDGGKEEFPDNNDVSYQAKSPKRGVSFNFNQLAEYDIPLLAPAVSWSYDWSHNLPLAKTEELFDKYGMEYVQMIWNGSYSPDKIRQYCGAHPEVEYLLAFNEPNLTDQANMTPAEAAALWPGVKALAEELGLKLISPAMNYGTKPGYNDPWIWLDEFFDQPGVSLDDVYGISIHCYMGSVSALKDFVGKFKKYGKPIWLTEFCNWTSQNVSAQAQMKYMVDAVNYLESDEDVARYAWFIPRGNGENECHNSLLSSGRLPITLTDLGQVFVNMSTQDKDLYYSEGQLIQAEHYSAVSGGVTLAPVTDTDGLLELGNLVDTHSVDYQVDVKGGVHEVVLRYRTYMEMNIIVTVGGIEHEVTLPDTGRAWATLNLELPFSDGRQIMKIGGISPASPLLNWFIIK